MKKVIESYLFSKHLLVGNAENAANTAFETVFALANLFGIRILSGQELACENVLRVAERELGVEVPVPFYRYFPKSVKKLSPGQVVFDQLFQLVLKFGLGYIHSGHPLYEERFAKIAFRENIEIKDFSIISETEAIELLREAVDNCLMSTRPVREDQYELILTFITEYDYEPRLCACKDIAIRLTMDTGDVRFADFISLSDIIKFTEVLSYERYGMRTIRRLNLKNKDRKLIARMLDRKLCKKVTDMELAACCEKRKLWCGLLHHIHYRPRTEEGKRVVKALREGPNLSAYSLFEQAMAEGEVKKAADILHRDKGPGALLRNLTYLLSRCTTAEEIEYIIEHIASGNIVMLMQMLSQYDYYNPNRSEARIFRFMRHGMICVHRESTGEHARRKSYLPEETIDDLSFVLRKALERICRGRLGRVYIDPLVVQKALPIQEASSSGGYNEFTSGSVIHLNRRHIVRLFCYGFEMVNWCLGTILVDEYGEQGTGHASGNAIVSSGNQCGGIEGRAQYIDVDMQALQNENAGKVRYVIVTLSTWQTQNAEVCAGYMQRDRMSSGDVFEPKTVQNNLHVHLEDYSSTYLFALDLAKSNLIFINRTMDEASGKGTAAFLLPYLRSQCVVNVHDLFCLLAQELTDDPMEADVIVTDDLSMKGREGAEVIHSYDTERMLALMNPGKQSGDSKLPKAE